MTAAQKTDAIAPEAMPRRFGKYTLMRRLAVGGMAELYLALQQSVAGFEKLIVVKRILPKLAQHQEFVEMLLSEARIAATLTHPNIAQVFDVGNSEGDYFIAMEHVHGEDLRSIVRQMKKMDVRAFPLEHSLGIILGCAKGLAYAHDKTGLDGRDMGIVHRDISPQNVLVTFDGDVKIVDFGIAKARGAGVEDTRSGKLKGKIPYMSPEQAQGTDLDGRSDIFSLGVILFELCTGRRLFKGPSEFDTLKMIVEEEYPDPLSYNPNLAPELVAIIHRALAKDPNKRYDNAHQLQSDLEVYIRDEQIKVSALDMRGFMQDLFKDKLANQQKMLQEGRELAEVLAVSTASDEYSISTGVSAVRTIPPSKTPWILSAVLLGALVGLGALAFSFMNTRSDGELKVLSTPKGAAIWVDGSRRSQKTPATLRNLPTDVPLSIQVTMDGFTPFEKTVTLTADAPHLDLEAVLAKRSAAKLAAVRVISSPAKADILLDGKAVPEKTPTTIAAISPGVEHTLTVSANGYAAQTQPLLLKAGEVRDVSVTLTPAALGPAESLIRIVTEPPSARVVFDGKTFDGGSPYEFRVDTKRYRALVVKTGFKSQEKSIRPEGGKVTDLTVSLARDSKSRSRTQTMAQTETMAFADSGPGKLTVDAVPWCNVSVDGKRLGQTPIVNFAVPSGKHRVVCAHPELGTKKFSVDVQAGKTTRKRIRL